MKGENSRESQRNKSRNRAARVHQGSGHWHVERRSNVLICRKCEARIPAWKDPDFCPECLAGRPDDDG